MYCFTMTTHYRNKVKHITTDSCRDTFGIKSRDGEKQSGRDGGHCVTSTYCDSSQWRLYLADPHVSLLMPVCRDESGDCHKPGQVLTLSRCMTKTCVLNDNRLFYEISTQACAIEGQCVNLNSTLTIRCVTYKCVKVHKGNNNYILKAEVLEVGCQDTKGVCHPVGARVKQNHCLEHTCKLTQNDVGFELTKAECYDSEQSVCRHAGEQWTTSDCHDVTCERSTSVDGTISLRVKTKSLGCPGDTGECYIPNDGQLFMKQMDHTSLQCQCISSNDGQSKPQYRCYSYRSEK
ncbi:hypothetical protein Btru_073346 [Bulinus truncatus]|nr:hypothetical protein Btru_073346 [Bulinus truncatus]